jgi:DNA-binding GntR family transcriptional regulator
MFMESIVGLLAKRGSKLEHISGYVAWELASHQEIVDALQARDAHLAHRLMSRHLEESAGRLLDTLDPRG